MDAHNRNALHGTTCYTHCQLSSTHMHARTHTHLYACSEECFHTVSRCGRAPEETLPWSQPPTFAVHPSLGLHKFASFRLIRNLHLLLLSLSCFRQILSELSTPAARQLSMAQLLTSQICLRRWRRKACVCQHATQTLSNESSHFSNLSVQLRI